jgi:Domain of unknown function (DUF6946)/HD domain
LIARDFCLMARIYVPTTGSHDWRWLLAQPGLHWKHGYSAMSLADRWEDANGWPLEVALALEGTDLAGAEVLLGLPEYKVPLPGGLAASQTDLFVLARHPAGGLITIAVEGKAEEPFGDQTVAEWRVSNSPGRATRLAYLLQLLGLPDDEKIGELRYQLLHRTASALIAAEQYGARDAVMLVHSFSPKDSSLDEFRAFARVLGAPAEKGKLVEARRPPGIRLHLGWISAQPPEENAITGVVGPRFDRAVIEARRLHAKQCRKGTEIPYLAHLLAVAALVLEDGGNEDQAIAALLHDAVEDQGGQPTLKRIQQLFGREVARIVDACSDTDVVPKPPWRERKEAYIAHLAEADEETLRVSCADKLHNARAILFDLRTVGDRLWERFNAGRDEVIWYYDALATAFETNLKTPMAHELRRTVDEIRAVACS